MLNPETTKQQLRDRILSTKGKTAAEVGHVGGNAVNLLLKADPCALQNWDLSNTVILGADFTKAILRNVNFTNANLSESLFAKVFGSVLSLAFSPCGQKLATGHENGEVRLWQVADGKQLWTRRGHDRFSLVLSVAYSPDSKTLASISGDEPIKIWDLESGKCLKKISAKLYAGANIAGVTGLTKAQKASMKALGAVKKPRNRVSRQN